MFTKQRGWSSSLVFRIWTLPVLSVICSSTSQFTVFFRSIAPPLLWFDPWTKKTLPPHSFFHLQGGPKKAPYFPFDLNFDRVEIFSKLIHHNNSEGWEILCAKFCEDQLWLSQSIFKNSKISLFMKTPFLTQNSCTRYDWLKQKNVPPSCLAGKSLISFWYEVP